MRKHWTLKATVSLLQMAVALNVAPAQEGQLKKASPPLYPPEAKACGITGTVTMKGIVGKDGHLHSLQAVDGPAELRQAAVQAANSWVYTPYTDHGVPVDVPTKVSVNFTMTNKEKKVAQAAQQCPTGMSQP